MVHLVNEKLDQIFIDFKASLNTEDICQLKDFNYKDDTIPDYSNKFIQKYYLLRYLAGYFAEYTYIYREILNRHFLDMDVEILSLGCGCGIDLLGAREAAQEMNNGVKNSIYNIKTYNGIDRIFWDYQERFPDEMNANYIELNIGDRDRIVYKDYNVVIFPKSIGEFTDDEFNHIVELIKEAEFRKERIALIGSMRKARNDIDKERLETILTTLVNYQNYEVKEVLKEPEDLRTKRIEHVVSNFVCPQNIKSFISNLITQCKKICSGERPCDMLCHRTLTNYPICTLSQATYETILLERKGA